MDGRDKNSCNILAVKPEGKGPLSGPSRRRKDNMRTHLRETGWEGVDLMHLVQDSDRWRVPVNTVMKLRVP
jgi:hypothetical protein